MRQITRCPACGTLFRVVADQLKISDGWVRCGHCAEVFDAPLHFIDEHALAAPSPEAAMARHDASSMTAADDVGAAMPPDSYEQSADAAPPMPVTAFAAGSLAGVERGPGAESPSEADDAVASRAREEDSEVDIAGASAAAQPAEVSTQPAVAVDDAIRPEVDATHEPDAITASELQAWRRRRDAEVQADADALDQAVEGRMDQSAVIDFDTSVSGDGAQDTAASAAVPYAADTDQADDTPAPAFVRQAERRAFWGQPRVRALMSVLVLALIGALGAQLILVERDRIAAHVPAARSLLQQACAVLGCEVGALRQIESVQVEGSSFTRLRPDTYRLGLVLRSSARVDIAMPSVELTLTSTQGQTLLRRVLSPTDMGAPPTLNAQSEWVGDLPLSLDDPQVASRVSGYTVLPFYP
ncbi:MAG: DUF3426 domain-containing protein [Burkholderiaceae bacterium]|nr:DUF3426 domain-containing protein [Burkholderiaceae bacterium]